MSRKVNQNVLIEHLINVLNDKDTNEITLSNTAKSLKIIEVLISRFGPLITSIEGGQILVKIPKNIENINLEQWEIQKYCNDHGIIIYPRQTTFGHYELIVERQGLIESQPGIYSTSKRKPTDEKWEVAIKLLYEHEYLNLKSIENE